MLYLRNFFRFQRIMPTTYNSIFTHSRDNLNLSKIYQTQFLRCGISVINEISATQRRQIHFGTALLKYNKQSSSENEEEDDDESDVEYKDERDSKVLKTKVNSLRADLLLRAGLGMARNKVEAAFYDSKIRLNGKKLAKKSDQLEVGDEIDLIRGLSQANFTHLYVARVVLLSATEGQEGVRVILRRYKSLLIENYTGVNAFKSSEVVGQTK